MVVRRIVAGLAAAGLAGVAAANNALVTNVTLAAPSAGKIPVQFDLSWDNSWRDSTNYDACWLFVKYSTDSGSNWAHATLGGSGTNPAGFSIGTGTNLEIVVPADKTGAFIQRAAEGWGGVTNTGVRLVWDFATNGVAYYQGVRVKVFAIEMVFVPEGAFYLGSGATTEAGHFYRYTVAGDSSFPYQVASGGPINIGATTNYLYYNASSINIGDGGGPLTNAFPKGYAPFYLMKMEISQRQYSDFLNTLTAAQQNNRYDSGLHYGSYRNYIKKTSNSPAIFGCDANNNAGTSTAVTNVALLNETNDAEWVACNYMSWMDVAAYLDWAALRPVTELEYEKAARGTLAPVSNEYAWGDANVGGYNAGLVYSATASESPTQGNCNCWGITAYIGPYRVGCYANASTIRTNAGAGYYGALDLSGSMWERLVSAGHASGRSFTGVHGDGNLSVNGNANATNWPGLAYGEVSGSGGGGARGSGTDQTTAFARLSDRSIAAADESARSDGRGGRGGRTAP